MKPRFKILIKSPKFLIGMAILTIIVAFALIYPFVNQANPYTKVGDMFEYPSKQHLLGTDNFGADTLLKIAYGTRTSMCIGVFAGLFAVTIGIVVGVLSGYMGGLVDSILMAITNIFIVIPPFILLIVISVSIKERNTLILGFIFGITSWSWTARTVRAQTSSIRQRDHVNIAKISGYGVIKIVVFEIMPYIASYVCMSFVIQIAMGIINEAFISIMGLGPEKSITLGLQLHWGLIYEAVNLEKWWAFVPPMIVITFITFALFFINSGMDEIFNPKIRS